MSDDNGQMQVEFRSRASEKFFGVCNAFEKATSGLNRGTDEHGFQQTKKQYATKMNEELQAIARDVLTKHKEANLSGDVDLMFHRFIQDYLHRFVQRANAM